MEQRWCGRGGYTPQNTEHTQTDRQKERLKWKWCCEESGRPAVSSVLHMRCYYFMLCAGHTLQLSRSRILVPLNVNTSACRSHFKLQYRCCMWPANLCSSKYYLGSFWHCWTQHCRFFSCKQPTLLPNICNSFGFLCISPVQYPLLVSFFFLKTLSLSCLHHK